MAERRMYAKTIVLSDAFLDMPMSARCLYFTLGMLADDDGFVNSPKSIMRQCGASNDDMNILFAKKFLIPFDSGVIVIKHWRINNYLRNDRYTPTKYQEEKSSLKIDEEGIYHIGIPMVDQRYPQDSIGKDSIGKDSIIDDFPLISPKTEENHISIEEVVDDFNDICNDLPKARQSYVLLQQITELINKGYTQENIHSVFEKASKCKFFKKPFSKGGRATILWLTELEHFEKTLSGYYDDTEEEKPVEKQFGIDMSRFDVDNICKRLEEEERRKNGTNGT